MKEVMRQAMADPEIRKQDEQHNKEVREAEMKVVGAQSFQINTPSPMKSEPSTLEERPWHNT